MRLKLLYPVDSLRRTTSAISQADFSIRLMGGGAGRCHPGLSSTTARLTMKVRDAPADAAQRQPAAMAPHRAEAPSRHASPSDISQSPRMVAQRHAIAAAFGPAVQRQEEPAEKIEPRDTFSEGDTRGQEPDVRKERAAAELITIIDGLDRVDGEALEAALGRLKEKYGLSKTHADISDPDNLKIELYASPALIIGGILLGVVVVVGIGIAGYCIYKRVKYDNIINRLVGAGFTRPDAETAFGLHANADDLVAWAPIMLRQIVDGVPLDAAMITSVQRQLGAAGKIQEIQEHGGAQNLTWSQQTGDLDGTAMGNWILDSTNPEPDPVGGQMNCWEVVMFSAYKMGYINWQHMHDAYLRDVGRQGLPNQEEQTAYFHTHIQTGAERTFDPNNPLSPKPLRGDIVLFETAEAHTAMAAGSDIAGSPEVFSLWDRPNHNYLQRLTVGALLAAGADEPVLFFSPRWP